MVDADRAFGIGWRDWGRLAAWSWLLMFAAAWMALPLVWSGGAAGYRVMGAGLAIVAAANGLPGAAAVLTAAVRRRLRELPEAAGLALLVMSGCSGFICTIAVCGLVGEGPGMAAAGMLVGVLAFPTTFGMAFPLGIPLLCAVVAWSDARRGGATTRRKFSVLTGAATVGWVGVGCLGLVLGKA